VLDQSSERGETGAHAGRREHEGPSCSPGVSAIRRAPWIQNRSLPNSK
jgi:hypothetical protein